jgi:arylsulfatase A-like enzyme
MEPDAALTGEGRRAGRPRLSPGTAILLAVWLGLAAGYLDLLFIAYKRLFINKEGSFRNARDFFWTVPLGHVALLLAPALVLALASWRWPRRVSIRTGAWILAALGLWGAMLRMPLYAASSLLLAVGLGTLVGDAASAWGFGPRARWVRRSLGGLLVVLIVLFAGSTGRQMLEESRAVAALPAAGAKAPNVLLIVWDTVRASDLSLYGYARSTTPNLEKWARRGVVYNRALSPSPWTYPSHSSFFTGGYPLQINSQWKYALDVPEPTLAEFLASKGYQTAGFAANTNCCNYETGLDRGFQRYEDYALTPASLLSRTVPGKWLLERGQSLVSYYDRKWTSLQSRGAREIDAAFLGWLDRRRSDRPFFAFLNFFDAHEPYIPPPGYAGRFGRGPQGARDYEFLIEYIGTIKSEVTPRDFAMTRDCYDDCLAFLDEQLDRLLGELERRGVLEETVVILTSDHGEGFGDHGVCGHSYSVNLEEVGVPLVVLAPGAPAGRTVQSAVSLRDLPATVADLAGLGASSPFRGGSLAAYWRVPPGEAPKSLASPAFSEQADETAFQAEPAETRGRRGYQMSLVTADGYQYIRDCLGREQLYNLWMDPRTLRNLAGAPVGQDMLLQFRKKLMEVLVENPATEEVERAYLRAFREELARQIGADEAKEVASRR